MIRFRKPLGLIRLVSVMLCIAMAPLASADEWGDLTEEEKIAIIEAIGDAINDLFNNGGWGHSGHGNNDSSDTGGDGNGDSTEGSDGSASDILGVDTPPTSGSSTTTEPTDQTPDVTPPGTTTDDPFGDIVEVNSEESEGEDTPTSITSVPYGSVPTIRDDGESVDYLLDKLIADAQQSASDEGNTPQSAMVLRKGYADYAKRLAKTLSKLSQAQQNIVFYGVE